MTMIYSKEKIGLAQMLARKHALRLELMGLKRPGQSVYSIIKQVHGLRGSKQSVYTQYCELVEKAKRGDYV